MCQQVDSRLKFVDAWVPEGAALGIIEAVWDDEGTNVEIVNGVDEGQELIEVHKVNSLNKTNEGIEVNAVNNDMMTTTGPTVCENGLVGY